MEQQAAVARFRHAAELLEGKWQRGLRQLTEEQMASCEEIRLRAGGQMTVLLPEGGDGAGRRRSHGDPPGFGTAV